MTTPVAGTPESDDALAMRARTGDPVALGELIERFAAPTWQTLVRLLGSRADADDALQDVFIGLPEALGRYAGRGRLGPWIRQVAVRVALMRLRSGRRRGEEALGDDVGRATQPAPVELRLAIKAALAALPVELRTVFVLKEVEGYSHAEIADLAGISVGLSEVRLFRARRRLRVMLSDQEGT
jgi:RNA polymerase sigma-70 factor (ECF subfamily)